MKFAVGDGVKLKVAKSYADGTTIPAGTRGEVEALHPVSRFCTVKFVGFGASRRVPEKDLAPA